LFVCFLKSRLSVKAAGQRRGAHYRDVKTLVNTFLKNFNTICD
jgi:hypothetical protein